MLGKKRRGGFENDFDNLEVPNMNKINAMDYNENDTSFDEDGGLGGNINEDLVDKSFTEDEEEFD
ncbi:hypothetical protein GW950_00795 [Candidatus Wolfebacteria bacterium]|nr:hypothetical protein [Candidatus Wolfebacteria bacterium]